MKIYTEIFSFSAYVCDILRTSIKQLRKASFIFIISRPSIWLFISWSSWNNTSRTGRTFISFIFRICICFVNFPILVKFTALDVITNRIYDICSRMFFIHELRLFSIRCALMSKKYLSGKRWVQEIGNLAVCVMSVIIICRCFATILRNLTACVV
jgi:hypothetical protein